MQAIFGLHSKMTYSRDVLEIHYFLGTMSNAIKHEVKSSSRRRYSVEGRNIAGITEQIVGLFCTAPSEH